MDILKSRNEIQGKRRWYKDAFTNTSVYNKICAAKTRLLLRHPFWGFMGLDLVLVEAPSELIPTLATDGYHIYYSAEFIDALTTNETIFVVAHEIYHCIFGHTKGYNKVNRMHHDDGYDPVLANRAQDYFINLDLIKAGLGSVINDNTQMKPVNDDTLMIGPIQVCYDTRFEGMSSEEIYRELVEDGDSSPESQVLDMHLEIEVVPDEDGDIEGSPSDNGEGSHSEKGDGDGKGKDESGNGNTIRIKMTESQFAEEKHRWEQIAQRAVANVDNSSQGAGSIPEHLKRLIGTIHKPKISWKTALRRFVQNVRDRGYSFIRPDRKTFGSGITLPGYRRDLSKLEIAVAFDTSGSVSSDQLNKFISELMGIMKSYRLYEIHAFCFEGSVDPTTYMKISGSAQQAEKDLKQYVADHVKGGGGTCFGSVWDFMSERKINPRGLVFFTDGYPCDSGWESTGRKGPPTLFVTVGNNNDWKAPFGLTVRYEDA